MDKPVIVRRSRSNPEIEVNPTCWIASAAPRNDVTPGKNKPSYPTELMGYHIKDKQKVHLNVGDALSAQTVQYLYKESITHRN